MKFVCVAIISSILFSELSLAKTECKQFYGKLPPEVQEQLEKQTAIAKSMAARANFVRITDHSSEVKEVVYKSTVAVEKKVGQNIHYEIQHRFLNRTSGTQVSVPYQLIEWLQKSDDSMALGNLKMKWAQLSAPTKRAAQVLEIAARQALTYFSSTSTNTSTGKGLIVTGGSQSYRENLIQDIEQFDGKMAALGLQIPVVTHVSVLDSKFQYGVTQVTAKELKPQDNQRPDSRNQYVVVLNRRRTKVSLSEILHQRMLSILKINYNQDGLIFKETMSFLSKDPTLSSAIADFIAAHVTNTPVVGDRNIETGEITAGVKIEGIKDLSRVGGEANSLLISKTLWNYRKIVGAQVVDKILPRLIRNLAMLRTAFEQTSFKPLRDEDVTYFYQRGKSLDRETSLQFEVENLKYFFASFLLAHDETPGLPAAGKKYAQDALKSFKFVLETDSPRERGIISGSYGMTSYLVPLASVEKVMKIPPLPKRPATSSDGSE